MWLLQPSSLLILSAFTAVADSATLPSHIENNALGPRAHDGLNERVSDPAELPTDPATADLQPRSPSTPLALRADELSRSDHRLEQRRPVDSEPPSPGQQSSGSPPRAPVDDAESYYVWWSYGHREKFYLRLRFYGRVPARLFSPYDEDAPVRNADLKRRADDTMARAKEVIPLEQRDKIPFWESRHKKSIQNRDFYLVGADFETNPISTSEVGVFVEGIKGWLASSGKRVNARRRRDAFNRLAGCASSSSLGSRPSNEAPPQRLRRRQNNVLELAQQRAEEREVWEICVNED